MKAIELNNITKKFGDLFANDSINLEVEKGEIHCLLGENGAGKSTLMKILFGLYSRDTGTIKIHGKDVELKNPGEAINLGIGMIHQHFMLVNQLTVAENIIAGIEPKRGLFLDMNKAKKMVKELSEKYGLKVNPEARIENISVGEQQRVEILKSLYRQAEILILDEPTAVLTPQEVDELFVVMRNLKQNNKTIIFITHKLKETMEIADRITILRDGKNVGTVEKTKTNPRELARMMVGREVHLQADKEPHKPGDIIFQVKDLEAENKKTYVTLKNISFDIKKGEILGVAGVAGNGQLELEESLMGLMKIKSGNVYFNNMEITNLNTAERKELGIAHIPSDRLKRGLIEDFDISKNMILGSEWKKPFANRGILIESKIKEYSEKIIRDFDIRMSSMRAKAADLSGGNQQKMVIGRELSREPELIITAQPTRGVDVGAIEYIHKLLIEKRDQGKGILLISAELDELRNLSDRIIVFYEGEIVATGKMEEFTDEELGLLMAGHQRGEVTNEKTD